MLLHQINKIKDVDFYELVDNNEKIGRLLKDIVLYLIQNKCPVCRRKMSENKGLSERLGLIWYCNNCKKRCSILTDSEFNNLKFKIKNILIFAYYFFICIHFP
ncbi:hypothetical protein DMUE_2475 [Dictyocoela muelleri]|nr:hypothetical protein DMUE_2475 [Dictyocoela muelleri]